jgi:DNA sulfur modification protein DndC
MGDTLVENPVMQSHADKMWALLREYVPRVLPGVRFIRTTPKETETFWVLLLGRGYRAPTRDFRWCTDKMKIRPKKDLFLEYPESICLLGTRRDESGDRRAGFERRSVQGRIRTSESGGISTFEPLEHLTTDTLWAFLLQNPPPWGGSHRDLISLYRSATGECPVVLSRDDAPSCGSQSARFGCWTCTVVKKDRSLRALADGEDGERLEPLLDFRERLREVSEGTTYRSDRRRNGQPGVGPLTLDTRKTLLDELLVVQGEVGQQLISPREIELIREQWERDGQRIPLSPEELAFEGPIKAPAVPLLQGGREHWQTIVSFADLVRICRVPEERPTSSARYQRDASWSRAAAISRYIRDNRDSYTLPPLVLCVSSCSYSDSDRTLTFHPGGEVLLVDGQHRRAAIEMALEQDRTLEAEGIGVVVYPYEDIARARQLFSDLNSGKPIPKSVQVFMDRRTLSPALAAMEQAPFSGWIEPVKTGLSSRSPYLWTLSALAQCPHLEDLDWWTSALRSLPGFLDVVAGKLSPAQARQRYVWAHGVGLRAIGESRSRISSPEMLSVVAWERKDPRWEGVASQKGKMLASNSALVADEIVSQVLAASVPFDIDW